MIKGRSHPISSAAEGLDRAPVRLTVLRIFGEVVDKGAMNDAIRVGRSTTQAFEVFQETSMHLGTRLGKSLRARIGASQTDHLMVRVD